MAAPPSCITMPDSATVPSDATNGTLQNNKRKPGYEARTAKKKRQRLKKKRREHNDHNRFIETVAIHEKPEAALGEDSIFEHYVLRPEDVEAAASVRALVHKVNKHVHIDQTALIKDVNHRRKVGARLGTDAPVIQRQHRWTVYISVQELSGAILKKPWFTVEQSTIKGAGIGVKAASHFKAGACLGIYLGVACSDSSSGRQNGRYMIESHRWGFVDARRGFADTDNPSYYMGMHMINDPAYGKNGAAAETARRLVNVRFYRDLLVYAIRDIAIGEELFVDYGSRYK